MSILRQTPGGVEVGDWANREFPVESPVEVRVRILFMCVANSARSQLAEGLARRIFPDAEIQSAGSNPGRLHPIAVRVMKESGIDISAQFSKSVADLPPGFVAGLTDVITLCAEEVCPVLMAPHARKRHWPFPDPASPEPLPEEVLLQRFRDARDAIEKRLLEFKTEIAR